MTINRLHGIVSRTLDKLDPFSPHRADLCEMFEEARHNWRRDPSLYRFVTGEILAYIAELPK